MKLRKMNVNNKGFSLVELMIVVAIIGLLAAIGVPQYAKFQARARQSEAKAALGSLYSAEQSFLQEWNGYTRDLRNAGFGVTGTNLRYVTGFAPGAACGGYPATAPTEATTAANTLSNGANVNVAGPTQAVFYNAGGVNMAAKATLTGATVCTAVLFTGVSEGDPKNTPLAVNADIWSIDQAKTLRNVTVGL